MDKQPASVRASPELKYGDSRRAWSAPFVEYMNAIVDHPAYAGMPCTRDDAGKIDWTIPSNRPRGSKNWDGNRQRRIWWQAKAEAVGIQRSGKWISKVAKAIHPFKAKPCQVCGRVMEIAYVYPTIATISQLNRLLPPTDQLVYVDFLNIDEVVRHIYTVSGASAATILKTVFPAVEQSVNPIATAQAIRQLYCATESRKFSPGAMANPPDRLEGFHTYNLCCRSRQDTGRTTVNLRSYGVDRRAFEQWCDGDWAIADSIMTLVRPGICSNCGEERTLTADHIGPISLGFAHSPHFRPLCLPCNSAKGNRMTLADVVELRDLENRGELVVSWQGRRLWDACKERVTTDEEALLLSKLMRILQHHYLASLQAALQVGAPDALLQFLHPEHALERVELVGFDPRRLTFESVRVSDRHDTYARMRASRITRVAFDSLKDYAAKPHRNIQSVAGDLVGGELEAFQEALNEALAQTSEYRARLIEILEAEQSQAVRDEKLARLQEGARQAPTFPRVRDSLQALLDAYAARLVARFDRREAVAWDDLVED